MKIGLFKGFARGDGLVPAAWLLVFLLICPALFGQTQSGGLKVTLEENNGGLTIISSQGTIKELVIPGTINDMPVVAIGDGAFTKRGLTKVVIPDSVTTIGDLAFSNNEISSLVIGNSVTSIGKKAFFSNKLETLSLGESLSEIGMGAFAENNLTELVIPEKLESIGAYAFFFNKLRILSIPGTVTNLGEGAFSGNRLHTLVINSGVEQIGDGAFFNNRLINITIPESVQNLGKRAFESRNTKSVEPPVDYLNEKGEILFTTATTFDAYYNANGKKPGKYTFSKNGWALEEGSLEFIPKQFIFEK